MALVTYKNLDVIKPNWNLPDHVIAFATTRQSGVSRQPYQSLNLGLHVDDDTRAVESNRKRLPFCDNIQWLN